MTTPDLVRTVEALANRMHVIAGLTTALGRSALVDAQQLVELGARSRAGVRHSILRRSSTRKRACWRRSST